MNGLHEGVDSFEATSPLPAKEDKDEDEDEDEEEACKLTPAEDGTERLLITEEDLGVCEELTKEGDARRTTGIARFKT